MVLEFMCKKTGQLMFEVDIPIKHMTVNFILNYECSVPGGLFIWISDFFQSVWWYFKYIQMLVGIYLLIYLCVIMFCLYPGSTVFFIIFPIKIFFQIRKNFEQFKKKYSKEPFNQISNIQEDTSLQQDDKFGSYIETESTKVPDSFEI